MKVSNLRALYRFLWNKDPDQIPSAYRFLLVLMGAGDSPYVSSSTIHHHLDEIIATSKDEGEVKIATLVKARLYIDVHLLDFEIHWRGNQQEASCDRYIQQCRNGDDKMGNK